MFYLSPSPQLPYSNFQGRMIPDAYVNDNDVMLQDATYADLCVGLQRVKNRSAELKALEAFMGAVAAWMKATNAPPETTVGDMLKLEGPPRSA
jgi:hypothetical protein